MAKSHSIEIGGHKFKSKTAARAFMKAMLNSYRPSNTVSIPDAEFLVAALRRHPEAVAKIGVGPQRFEVRSAEYGTQCFCIIRTDGSEERFSYISCV